MKNIRIIQTLVVLAAIVLTVILYRLPVANPNAEKKEIPAMNKGFDTKEYIEEVKKSLPPAQLQPVLQLEKSLEQKESETVLDSIGLAWDNLNQPAISAYYFEKRAAIVNTERGYIEAAYRYFDAFKVAGDSMVRNEMVSHAIANYQKVIEINPKNLDAKTDLGVCYTEGTGTPMQGIMLLREVIAADPKHENAQLNLGMLSIKSGQFPKAIERFDKVLEINPTRVDIYVFKGQTYLRMNDTTNAIASFNRYLEKSNDVAGKKQVTDFINELKSGK